MKYGVLRGNGLKNNEIFDRGSPKNRDGCFEPYALLKETFAKFGVQLETSDKGGRSLVDFEIHQDCQQDVCAGKNYLMMFETSFVQPNNGVVALLNRYNKIFKCFRAPGLIQHPALAAIPTSVEIAK